MALLLRFWRAIAHPDPSFTDRPNWMPTFSESHQTSDLPHEVARAVELLFDRKAEEVTLLDLRDVSGTSDFFLIATGRSDTHVSAIGDFVVDELKKEGVRPYGVEGMRSGRWVLLDYVDFVVHIFHPAARDFYQLERLWGDAEIRELEPEGQT